MPLEFTVDENKCTRCGRCAADCPVRIIAMPEGGFPAIPEQAEAACFQCQHCLAVCPTAAVSILGKKPGDSRSLQGNLPDPARLETLIRGRRSVRRYRDENIDPALLQRLLDTAGHAPSGHNARQVRFTVVDDRAAMARLREKTILGLEAALRERRLPKRLGFMADFVPLWKEQGVDALFRGAPHLLIASAPKGSASSSADCLIALSYFELLAQSLGVGTVWDGLAKYVVDDFVPGLRSLLGIPEDHLIGYMMAFGYPAVEYQRTVQHGPARVVRAEI